ncbi:MAG: hypothetical protein AAGL90_13980 [Pseudomonadota bacterium]
MGSGIDRANCRFGIALKGLTVIGLASAFAMPALAQCDETHSRNVTANHVEIVFKNETDQNIHLLIEKSDYETQDERKTVQSKTVKAGTKSQYDSTMSEHAEKTFFITYADVSGKFHVLNDKYYPENQPAAYVSEFRGAKLSPITSQESVECHEQFKTNNARWSVSIQVN